MTLLPRRLRHRLFVSYALVVAAGAVTMIITSAFVTRTVYRRQLRGLGRGPGRNDRAGDDALTGALDESLWVALLAGTAAALIVAAFVAWFLGNRLLRPLDDVRAATRRLAAGDYDVRVEPPAEPELASLAHDVNTLGDHLAETERRRSHLLGEVTHEMRTPLTVIGGRLEGLIDGVIEPAPATFAALADEAGRLERLVDDLTLLSRADEGTLTIDPEPVDLNDIVSSVVSRFESQFEHAGVALLHDVGVAVPIVGDPQRLAQILGNIVGNALGHTEPGGSVTVRVGADEVAWVEVTDTGDGIAPAEIDAVFERFYRSPSSGRAGRGIGLTIARSLARAHGGDVTATSPGRGRGATFRLTLPLRSADHARSTTRGA